MDLPPPPPRLPALGSGRGGGGRTSSGTAAALRKQALAGAHRSTTAGSHHIDALIEEEEGGLGGAAAAADGQQPDHHGVVSEGKGRHSVQLRAWQDYWDERKVVEVPGRGTFPVYLAGSSGPVVMCIHGGGYTGLTWSLVAARLKDSFRVVAPDLRGHGGAVTADDGDFSAETMTADIIEIWHALFGTDGGGSGSTADTGGASSPADGGGTSTAAAAPAPPATLLVGHSMGGALAARAAAAARGIPGLAGVAIVDVVEGTALAALPHMRAVLAARPRRFASPQAAADWAVRSGACRRAEAAGVSFPSQVVPCGDNSGDVGGGGVNSSSGGGDGNGGSSNNNSSGGGGGNGNAGNNNSSSGGGWRWRTPLERSEPYWEGWYRGLSALFLALPVPKLLLLAGTDRLDRELTIGQMQGKFQLALLPAAGHAVHEDEPDATASHLAAFARRFRMGEPPLALPRAPPGTRPALPVAAGPLLAPGGGGGGAGGG